MPWSFIETVQPWGTSISPCVHNSQMDCQHCSVNMLISLINSVTHFGHNLPPLILWVSHLFAHSWLATLPPTSQGTLSPLHRTLLPSYHQVHQHTHLPPVPWPFLPPTNQDCLASWLTNHRLLFSEIIIHYLVSSQMNFSQWNLSTCLFHLKIHLTKTWRPSSYCPLSQILWKSFFLLLFTIPHSSHYRLPLGPSTRLK